MQREILEIDYVPVPYHVSGTGPPLILIHLPTCSLHCFERNAEVLAKQFQVFVVDLRPAVVLKTWLMRGISLLDYLEEILLSFMDRLSVPRATLIGAHKAGAVAMYVAARHKDRIDRLVLISTLGLSRLPGNSTPFKVIFFFMKWPGVPFMGRVRSIRRLVKWFDRHGVGQWRVRQFFCGDETKDWAALTRQLVKIYTTFLHTPDVWAFEVMIYTIGYLKYAPVVKLMPNITQETLLIFGDDKRGVPRKVIDKYASLLPNATIAMIPNTRLYPHFEQAEHINELTAKFLTGSS
jgi:pimeloyl-ACP methyl ester carboxylesterase